MNIFRTACEYKVLETYENFGYIIYLHGKDPFFFFFLLVGGFVVCYLIVLYGSSLKVLKRAHSRNMLLCFCNGIISHFNLEIAFFWFFILPCVQIAVSLQTR